MSELTLKAIEQLFDAKFSKELQPIKADITAIKTGVGSLSEELRVTERRLMKHGEDLQSELARIAADGFADLQHRLDVHEEIARLHKQMAEVRAALHLN